jgi:hypothetical protein
MSITGMVMMDLRTALANATSTPLKLPFLTPSSMEVRLKHEKVES